MSQPSRHAARGLVRSTAISAFALAVSSVAHAQTAPAGGQAALPANEDGAQTKEIVVTASRRGLDISKIPYNITAVSAGQIEHTGVSTVQDLSRQVPNLIVTSSGNGFIATQREIIRGLNASDSTRRGAALEQNPVSTYLGNAPFANYFKVDDIERVEVLRGPQGTLYGAGTLGGAIRLIPTAPEIGKFDGQVKLTGGLIQHSTDKDYSINGLVNLPLGKTVALRVSVDHDRDGGYINQYGVYVRTGDPTFGAPVLADPGSPLTSAPLTKNVPHANWSESTSIRASLRWKPNSQFDATLSFNHSLFDGIDNNLDTSGYQGGPNPLSPSISFPATGNYQFASPTVPPFRRSSNMATLDMTYDVGFATLSSTSSYFHTDGAAAYDATWESVGVWTATNILPYYAGSPTNPRFNNVQQFVDSDKAFTQEIRLVSKAGGPVDYIVGAYYQWDSNVTFWDGYAPGQSAYDALPGVTIPGYPPMANDQVWHTGGTNDFKDIAGFGEVTWHVKPKLDITGGIRVFKQTLNRVTTNILPLFGIDVQAPNTQSFSSAKFKANITYEYIPDQRIYFTFSQGFRRGGANAFSLAGPLAESSSLLNYKPDTVNNFEVGFKGKLSNGLRYTVDGFIDNWENPQIGGFTAYNFWPVAFNGSKAQSKGIEVELIDRLTPSLNVTLGYAYSDAKLTENFCLPSNYFNGTAVVTNPCAIVGIAGTQLPSAPKNSGTASISYDHMISSRDRLSLLLNANYKDDTRQTLPEVTQKYPLLPSYWLVNAYASVTRGPATIALYGRNIFDKRVIEGESVRFSNYNNLDSYNTVGRPREIGIELTVKFK
jgi:iron complex outermembrane recepter protein